MLRRRKRWLDGDTTCPRPLFFERPLPSFFNHQLPDFLHVSAIPSSLLLREAVRRDSLPTDNDTGDRRAKHLFADVKIANLSGEAVAGKIPSSSGIHHSLIKKVPRPGLEPGTN